MLVLADRWGAAAKLGFLLTLAALPAANANDKFRFHLHGLAADTATVIDKEGNDVSAELHSVGRTKTGVSLEGVGGSRIDVIGAPPLGGDMTIVLVARRFSAAGASSESTCLFDISNGFATNNIQLCTASDDSQRLIFQVRKNALGLKGTPGFGGNYPVETGERLHIVVTTDVDESTMVIYINGVETGTSTGTFGWAPDIEARSSFIIGGSLDVNGGVVNAFEGEISYFAHWDEVYDQGQVTASYNAWSPIMEHSWDFRPASVSGATQFHDSISGLVAYPYAGAAAGKGKLSFDGISGYVDLEGSSTNIWGGPLTIEMVVRLNQLTDATTLFHCSGGDATTNRISITLNSDGRVTWTVGRNTPAVTSSSLIVGQRHHVVVTASGNNGAGLKVYIDGVLLDTQKGGEVGYIAPVVADHTSGCYVGRNFAGIPPWLDGDVYYVKIYSGVASQTDVSFAWGAVFPFPEHSWDFRGLPADSSTTVIDSIGGVAAIATWVDAPALNKLQTGFTLDGINDFFKLELNQNSVQLGGPMTIEVIVKYTGSARDDQRVFSCGNGVYTDVITNQLESDGRLRFRVYGPSTTSSSPAGSCTTAAGEIKQEIRYHIVQSVTASAGAKQYINGVLSHSNPSFDVPATKVRTGCYIGKQWANLGLLAGEVSLLKIYSGEMSAADVLVAYQSSFPVLEYWWDFTQASNFLTDKVANIVAVPHNGYVKTAKGYVLDGSNGRIELGPSPTPAAIKFGGPITVEIIARWGSFNQNNPIFECAKPPLIPGFGASPSDVIKMYSPTTTSVLAFEVYLRSGNALFPTDTRKWVSSTSAVLTQRKRYHIVGTVSGTTYMSAYLNGVEVAKLGNGAPGTDSSGQEPKWISRPACMIGKSSWTSQGQLKTSIASIKIYSGSMTAAQVATKYAAEFPYLEWSWDFSGLQSHLGDIILDTTGGVKAILRTEGATNAVKTATGVQMLASQLSYIELVFSDSSLTDAERDLQRLGGEMTIMIGARGVGASLGTGVVETGKRSYLFCYAERTGGDTEKEQLAIFRSDADRLYVRYQVCESTCATVNYAFSTTFDAASPHHITVTLDASGGVDAYVNGVVLENDIVTTTGTANAKELAFTNRGACFLNHVVQWGGYAADTEYMGISFYSGVMGDTQIASIYNTWRSTNEKQTNNPTSAPTTAPSNSPTNVPTASTGPTHAPSNTPTAAPSSVPTSAPSFAPTTSPTKAPTRILGALVKVKEPAAVVREDGTGNVQEILSLDLAAVPQVALTAGEVATVSCASNPEELVLEPSSFQVTPDASSSAKIAVRGARDRNQLASRTGVATCEVSAPGRVSQTFSIEVTVLGVAQPSFSLLCSIARGSDPLRTIAELGTCGTTATTNGNSSLLIIGGDPIGASPQPPFDTSATTRVSIGGVSAIAQVVNGSRGTRLLVVTPTIEELQAARGEAVENFIFGYYGFEIVTSGGVPPAFGAAAASAYQGEFDGSIAVGVNANITDAATGRQQCAVLGFCPDAMPSGAGLFYSDKCVGWPDPVVDMRWQDAASADLFAYGRPPFCRACPLGCRCPGGNRCRPIPGYFVSGEDLGTAAQPARCAPPALQRCVGFAASVGGTQCGTGFEQGSSGCSHCAAGHFRSMGGCAVCPAVDLMGAVVMPIVANVAAAVAAFAAIFGVKLVWSIISALCDPDDERKIGVVAYDALRQTAFFVVATIIGLQLLASVLVGATGDAPATLRMLALGLGTFVFEPPMVNPDCVTGFDYSGMTKIAILAGALIAAVLDKTLQLVPWLRAEALICGWKCCSKVAPFRGLRKLTYTLATPFFRYFLSTGLTVVYVRVVRVAIATVDCAPSDALGGAYALDANDVTPCFDDANLPIFVLAVVTIIFFGALWPLATVLVLWQRFALQARAWAKRPACLDKCCDLGPVAMGMDERSVRGGSGLGDEGEMGDLPEGWSKHFSIERGMSYYAHVESGASLWERPTIATAAEAERRAVAGSMRVLTNIDGATQDPLGSGPLEEGWEEHYSPEAKRKYYHHAASCQTLWEKPARDRAAAAVAAHDERNKQLGQSNASATSWVQTVAKGVNEEAEEEAEVDDGDEAALPSGWEKHYSPEHRTHYFHHEASGQTKWVTPTERSATIRGSGRVSGLGSHMNNPLANPLPSPLVVGWEEHFDETTNSSFFHHAASNKTVWERPSRTRGSSIAAAVRVVGVQAAGSSTAEGVREAQGEGDDGEEEEEEDVLPEGWNKHFSVEHGKHYFHNKVSSRTSWTVPMKTKMKVPCEEGMAINISAEGATSSSSSSFEFQQKASNLSTKKACFKSAHYVNEVGCVPVCWRKCLGVAVAPMIVQQRVNTLGGRARAYDQYVDNAFEPRFFWIPALRMYTLLLLTVFDLSLSGRAPPTLGGAIARCVLSSLVVFIFTVAVLGVCPYHRIDRWNIAKRLALLVLNVVGATTTMCLTLVELTDGSQVAKDATTFCALALLCLLPICFVGVLLAFLLSRGTGCCARTCCHSKEYTTRLQMAKLRTQAASQHGVVTGDGATKSIEMMRQRASSTSLGGPAVPRGSIAANILERLAAFGSTRARTINGGNGANGLQGGSDSSSNLHISRNGSTQEFQTVTRPQGLLPTQMANPMVNTLHAARTSALGVQIKIQENSGDSTTSSSSSDEEESDDEPRFVTWRARKSEATTLGNALYGGYGPDADPADVAAARRKIDAHILQMFGGKSSITVPATLKLLRTRAKGTDLGGNMHAQLSLVQASSTDDHAGGVTPVGFGAALHASVGADPNGAVAEWLLDELAAAESSAATI